MISEDAEDSNDADNTVLHYRNKLHLKKYSIRNSCFKLFHNITIFWIEQMQPWRDFILRKTYWAQTFER